MISCSTSIDRPIVTSGVDLRDHRIGFCGNCRRIEGSKKEGRDDKKDMDRLATMLLLFPTTIDCSADDPATHHPPARAARRETQGRKLAETAARAARAEQPGSSSSSMGSGATFNRNGWQLDDIWGECRRSDRWRSWRHGRWRRRFGRSGCWRRRGRQRRPDPTKREPTVLRPCRRGAAPARRPQAAPTVVVVSACRETAGTPGIASRFPEAYSGSE